MFAATADLALAIALVAVTVSTLRSDARPQRARSWLFFSAGSVVLVVRAGLDAFGPATISDAVVLLEVATLGLFTVGFVLLYGAERDRSRVIETHAERDPITGLLNRRAFRDVVAKRLERAVGTPSALAMLDLDGFKAVNDSRGHPAGDEVLRLVAAGIRANLRPSDVAARYGGDEFIVFLESCGTPEAQRILTRMRTIIAGVTGSANAGVTASVGIVTVGGDTRDLDELIHAADRALIEVKHTGKDHIRVSEDPAR